MECQSWSELPLGLQPCLPCMLQSSATRNLLPPSACWAGAADAGRQLMISGLDQQGSWHADMAEHQAVHGLAHIHIAE